MTEKTSSQLHVAAVNGDQTAEAELEARAASGDIVAYAGWLFLRADQPPPRKRA